MNTDFANAKRKSGKTRQASASMRSPAQEIAPPWAWFVSGLLCGIFLSGLTWLALQQANGRPGAVPDETESSASGRDSPGPRFDFYTLLPEQKIDLELAAGYPAPTPGAETEGQYLLQAGSFKQAEDADRRRAQLLLLGLKASVEEAEGDNGHWFRVYIGPFQSRSKLAQARGLTAQQGIDTLLLKRPRQNRG